MDMGMDVDMDMDIHRRGHVMDLDMELDTDTDTIFFVSVRTEINRNSICFGLFAKLLCNGHWREHGHGHFSFVSVCFERSLDVSVILKHRNKLFRY
jgi:hypothetical protein